MSLFLLVATVAARGDIFTYVDKDNAEHTLEARIAGEGQGFFALEAADGRIEIVHRGAIMNREPKEGPKPVDEEGMIEVLQQEFGEDKIFAESANGYISAIVLAAPIEKKQEGKAKAWLKSAVRFQKTVDSTFASYAKSMRIDCEKPRFPLVLLIFESESEFEDYNEKISEGRGLSASNTAGFYYGPTNWLAVRMGECFSLEVPLHEAIHQQVYNRGFFQRLAPIPAWFNEGIDTGFENEGDRIRTNPLKINVRYARQAHAAQQVSWADLVTADTAFRGDVLAGEAYTHGWCLHWMLARKHKDEYVAYVKDLGSRTPLEVVDDDERLAQFEKLFGQSVDSLQTEFPEVLTFEAKKQKVSLPMPPQPGYSVTDEASCTVRMEAVNVVDQGNRLNLRGTVQNLSPFREMTIYVAVVTESGLYADWLLPSVDAKDKAKLSPQVANKVIPGTTGGPSSTFRVRIFSTPAGSELAKTWASGSPPDLSNR